MDISTQSVALACSPFTNTTIQTSESTNCKLGVSNDTTIQTSESTNCKLGVSNQTTIQTSESTNCKLGVSNSCILIHTMSPETIHDTNDNRVMDLFTQKDVHRYSSTAHTKIQTSESTPESIQTSELNKRHLEETHCSLLINYQSSKTNTNIDDNLSNLEQLKKKRKTQTSDLCTTLDTSKENRDNTTNHSNVTNKTIIKTSRQIMNQPQSPQPLI